MLSNCFTFLQRAAKLALHAQYMLQRIHPSICLFVRHTPVLCQNDKFGYLNPILGKLGVTHDVGWWLVGKPTVDFLFALIEPFFAICYGSGAMRRNVFSSAVFTGGQPFCSQILPVVVNINHSWHQKTRDGEDLIPLCSIVGSFWHNMPISTAVWRTGGHTGGQTDGSAVIFEDNIPWTRQSLCTKIGRDKL